MKTSRYRNKHDKVDNTYVTYVVFTLDNIAEVFAEYLMDVDKHPWRFGEYKRIEKLLERLGKVKINYKKVVPE